MSGRIFDDDLIIQANQLALIGGSTMVIQTPALTQTIGTLTQTITTLNQSMTNLTQLASQDVMIAAGDDMTLNAVDDLNINGNDVTINSVDDEHLIFNGDRFYGARELDLTLDASSCRTGGGVVARFSYTRVNAVVNGVIQFDNGAGKLTQAGNTTATANIIFATPSPDRPGAQPAIFPIQVLYDGAIQMGLLTFDSGLGAGQIQISQADGTAFATAKNLQVTSDVIVSFHTSYP